MRLLIDTDVILDLALDRPPHAAHSARIFQAIQAGSASAVVAWHTISNLYYLLSSGRNKTRAIEFIADLSALLEVAPANDETLRTALALQMRDFEDAMQAACAVAAGAEAIVTRNVRDFAGSPLPAIAPRDLHLGRNTAR